MLIAFQTMKSCKCSRVRCTI